MIQYMLECSACLLLFYIGYHWLYRNTQQHRFNRAYLIAALMTSLLLPLLHVPLIPEYIVFDKQPFVRPAAPATTPGFLQTHWRSLLLYAYLVGAIGHLLLSLWRIYRLSGIIRRGLHEKQPDHSRVYTREDIPVSSFLHYLIISEQHRSDFTDYELQHELVHIRQRHSLDVLLLEVMRIFFWFHPVLIFYQRRLIEVHEYLADEGAIRNTDREAYEAFLISRVATDWQPPLAHNFYSLFKKRIDMMHSRKNTASWQFWMILPMLAISFLSFSTDKYLVFPSNGERGEVIPVDTFPPLPPELIGKEIDTVITFDPVTFEETVEYFERGTFPMGDEKGIRPPGGSEELVDTIIVFDPATGKETIQVVKSIVPPRDSL